MALKLTPKRSSLQVQSDGITFVACTSQSGVALATRGVALLDQFDRFTFGNMRILYGDATSSAQQDSRFAFDGQMVWLCKDVHSAPPPGRGKDRVPSAAALRSEAFGKAL